MCACDQTNDETAIRLKSEIAAGNQEAFRQLFNNYSEKLVQFAYALVKNHIAARDIVNEVFVKIWKRREQVTGIMNLRVYLYTATKNTGLNYLSRKAHEQVTEPFDHISIALRDDRCPEQELITHEIFNKIHQAIDQLPPRCKMIFKLIREDGLQYKEVAEVLNISIHTVDAQMAIAIRKISDKVRGEFESFPALHPKKK
jgi:RNA polymerase sigma-70 factor (family 1)